MLLADILSWGMFCAGLVMMTMILMRRWVRYYGWGRNSRPGTGVSRANQTLDKLLPGPRLDLPLGDAPPECLRWQVEMHTLARDLKGELDSKIGILQTLVTMARQESLRLESALDRAAGRELADRN